MLLTKAPPEIQNRFKRVKMGDADAWVVALNGSMLPWDKMDIEQYEENKGD